MGGYEIFSSYYDELTFNVDYDKRVKYICDILSRLKHNFGLSLDLACGTGTLTIMLKEKGVDIIGVDSSVDMLSVASMKSFDKGMNILFVNQLMQELELPYNVDTCICTLDAINHIIDLDDIEKTFSKVYKYLNVGGCFIFDVNTVYKHQKILGNNCFTYDVDDVFLTWNNKLEKNNIVDISLEFDDRCGNIYYENFKERAYEINELQNMLQNIGFEVVNIYDDLTFNTVSEESEKATFVVKKK